jgi:hypothetical protein
VVGGIHPRADHPIFMVAAERHDRRGYARLELQDCVDAPLAVGSAVHVVPEEDHRIVRTEPAADCMEHVFQRQPVPVNVSNGDGGHDGVYAPPEAGKETYQQ